MTSERPTWRLKLTMAIANETKSTLGHALLVQCFSRVAGQSTFCLGTQMAMWTGLFHAGCWMELKSWQGLAMWIHAQDRNITLRMKVYKGEKYEEFHDCSIAS